MCQPIPGKRTTKQGRRRRALNFFNECARKTAAAAVYSYSSTEAVSPNTYSSTSYHGGHKGGMILLLYRSVAVLLCCCCTFGVSEESIAEKVVNSSRSIEHDPKLTRQRGGRGVNTSSPQTEQSLTSSTVTPSPEVIARQPRLSLAILAAVPMRVEQVQQRGATDARKYYNYGRSALRLVLLSPAVCAPGTKTRKG